MKRREFIKGIVVGFIIGTLLTSCSDDFLFADDDYNYDGGIGSSEYNPMYVKIVD